MNFQLKLFEHEEQKRNEESCFFLNFRSRNQKMKIFHKIFLVLFAIDYVHSLSFVDFLSTIIDNGRFVEENYINSNFSIEPFIPTIQSDLFVNMNASNCTRDMQILAFELLEKRIWALKSKFDK